MTRFLTAVVATFFLLTAVAHAAGALIYDRSVNDILNEIKKAQKQYSSFNVKIRGTHYYTGNDGFKYRESYFGISDKNRLIFQLNDKGAVWAAWIIVPENATYQDSSIGSHLFSMIMWEIGLSNKELDKLIVDMRNAVDKYKKQKISDATQTFSVWCAKAKRYINLKVSMKDAHTDNAVASYSIYAHN